MLTLSDAANAAGVAKSTIWRAIKAGRISASRTVVGSYQVDAAELFRVFPLVQKNDPTKQVATTAIEHVGTAAQEAQIAALKDISGLLRDQLEDLRKDRDAWRGQAESNQRLLIDARKRRGLFGWGSRTL
jgi:predicted site-specific integrase-resolvase